MFLNFSGICKTSSVLYANLSLNLNMTYILRTYHTLFSVMPKIISMLLNLNSARTFCSTYSYCSFCTRYSVNNRLLIISYRFLWNFVSYKLLVEVDKFMTTLNDNNKLIKQKSKSSNLSNLGNYDILQNSFLYRLWAIKYFIKKCSSRWKKWKLKLIQPYKTRLKILQTLSIEIYVLCIRFSVVRYS